jgi:hypothetical protein
MRIPYRQKLLTTFAVAVALALMPSTVFAQDISPEGAQYGDQAQKFEGAVNRSDPSASEPTASRVIGALPFTGADLIVLASGAVLLLGSGLLLRRQAGTRN